MAFFAFAFGLALAFALAFGLAAAIGFGLAATAGFGATDGGRASGGQDDTPTQALGEVREAAIGPRDERRAREETSNLRARDLDRRRRAHRIRVDGERGERREPDHERPRAGQPHAPFE